MSLQTHIERLAAERERARTPPAVDRDGKEDAASVPTSARAVEAARGAWTVGSVVAGRFVLEQRLGRGRYGPIYKALDRSLSEALIGVEHHVALQEMHPRIAAHASLIERLEQLPLQPQSWSHPNITKVLEFGRDGAKLFLCEELLEGASLRLVLDQAAPEALSADEVLGVLRAVGDALNYAHAKGVVHGDLRPENVFVTEAYRVKLLGLMPSTEPRLAPVFAEDPDTGNQPHPSDDVYGLACLAYELMTGRHPYNGNSPLEALRAGLLPHPAPDLPPLRWQALARGLALRREQRTASVPELLAGLGVTGTEALRPGSAPEQPLPPPRAVELAPAWPEVTDPNASADRERHAARVAATAAPVDPIPVPPNAAPAAIYAEPREPVERRQRAVRRASRTRAIFAAAFAAALGTLVYLDYTRLRLQAGDLIETGAAFVSREVARRQAQPSAPAPTAPSSGNAPAAGAQLGAVTPQEPAQDPPAAAPAQEAEAVVSAEAPVGDAAEEVGGREATEQNPDEAAGAQRALPPASPTPTPTPTPTPAVAAASPPRFHFAERTVTVNESDVSARIVIRRTGSLDAEASVVWWATEGTALADEDFAVLGARIETFAVGEESRVIHVPLIDDSQPEQLETFFVNLRAERAGAGAATQVEVVVRDDDR